MTEPKEAKYAKGMVLPGRGMCKRYTGKRVKRESGNARQAV
jgi:hypothetical protein